MCAFPLQGTPTEVLEGREGVGVQKRIGWRRPQLMCRGDSCTQTAAKAIIVGTLHDDMPRIVEASAGTQGRVPE